MTDDRTDSVPRRSTRRKAVFVAAIVVAVILVVVLVIAGISRGRSSPTAESSSPLPSVSQPAKYTAPPSPSITTSAPAPTTSTFARPESTKKPVPLTGTATPVAGVTAEVTSLTAVTGKAAGIGETDGPALRVVVSLTNDTGKAISLANVVVSLTYGTAATPADELTSARKALAPSLGAGRTATGTYEFTIATADRDDTTITLDYGSGTPLVAFTGSSPK